MRSFYLLILTFICMVCCASCGPRMRVQPSIQPYEQRMPEIPEGAVPITGSLDAFTEEQSRLASNPLAETEANVRNGRIYYGYYCLMCHGKDGKGNGPVGQSYDPKPTDLTAQAVTGMSDGELYIRMLTGTGHDPVLTQTVLKDHRWPIVIYIRNIKE